MTKERKIDDDELEVVSGGTDVDPRPRRRFTASPDPLNKPIGGGGGIPGHDEMEDEEIPSGGNVNPQPNE